MGIRPSPRQPTKEKNSMGIKKVTVYVCDNKTCNKEGEDESLFATDVPVQHGEAKKKAVLCEDCRTEYDDLMARYFADDEEEETQEDEYSPQVDPRMKKLTPEERDFHYAAKQWALGPKSTMNSQTKPTGVRGPAGPKVLAAYEAYLENLRAKVAADEAAVNGNGKAAT
jgi:hypothetical protein